MPKPKPTTDTIHIRLPVKLIKQMQRTAAAERRTFASYVRNLVTDAHTSRST